MADPLVLVTKLGRKSKNKMNICGLLLTILIVQNIILDSVTCSSQCPDKGCVEGKCVDGKCECDRGWAGEKCEKCYGRRRLNGTLGSIYDGEGNYTLDTKCSWLIKTNAINTTFRLKFHQFATECGWDHLYIHDGDSAFSPLLAAYSGLLMSKDQAFTEVDFFTHIRQPYIYIHFYSDAAYTMSGFNITYSIGDCPKGCSGNGDCIQSKCMCHPLWDGDACEIPMCPNNCSNKGQCVKTVCQCDTGYRGSDCSLTTKDDVWSLVQTQNPPVGRASHTALLDKDNMWVVGGYTLNDYNYHEMLRYNLSTKTWHAEKSDSSPPPRYGHSTVLYDNKLYMYGGVVNGVPVSDNWMYNIAAGTWTNLTSSYLQVSGHTAHEYNGKIHVIFGYSPLYGYMNKVQLYDIENDSWMEALTIGATVRGGYGHTSVWDPNSKKIYVYGGYHSAGSQSSYNLTDVLYSYDPQHMKWMCLKNSGSPRYLHAAVVLNGLMLVYGGNTHNDTSVSYGAKCYSSDFMAYDINCNTWHHLATPTLSDISRYGHTMVLKDSTVYVFGGFNGVMRNDVTAFIPGLCSAYNSTADCTAAKPGVLCMWENDRCQTKVDKCDSAHTDGSVNCEMFTSCPNCVNNEYNCSWCENKCKKTDDKCSTTDLPCNNAIDFACEHHSTCEACLKNTTVCTWDRQHCVLKGLPQVNAELCPPPIDSRCGTFHSCGACLREELCIWKRDTSSCRSIFQIQADDSNIHPAVCPLPCSVRKSCSNCTSNTCMWCSNMQQCVETNSYVASFPYGQCTEWTTKESKCAATACSGLHSCKECQAHPMCGWCNDPSNTGLGKCMEGGLDGPINMTDKEHKVQHGQCPAQQWFFIDCPKCQCNGHSTCINDTSKCEKCQNRTTGSTCETCEDGYHGNPKNGGVCVACECNGQADSCDPGTGVCYCRTRGVTGDKCDRCDDTHKYYGDPKLGGTCYYQLVTDYQFTFNLSKPDDKHYTQINFMNIPKASDRDVDFTLNCSGDALLNITHRSKSRPEEQYIVHDYKCNYFRTKFEHKDYAFAGDENTTFRVYVYGFKTPFWLQISFSQFPKIDLVHFFVTFFSCFLSLLLIAAALWKIKHKYDSYRRRQQMIVEMQQMASRPFATVTVEIDRKVDSEKKDHKETTDFRKRKRGGTKPAAIALEPLHNAKAAILTVIIQLPTGHEEFAPCGQSGVAMGSTLITYGGNTRKQSVEHMRGDKPRLRKHLPTHHHQPDTSA